MKNKIIIGLISAVVIVGGYVGITYNSIMSANEAVESQFATIESKLQRRYDLIPNLVNSVKGTMKQEEKIFSDIAESRAKLAGAKSVEDKITASNEVEKSMSKLTLALVERYPDLKSSENVTKLMDELAGTESRISVERDRYNTSVKNFNKKIKKFPANIVANAFGFEPKTYFEANDGAEETPTVNLN
ncbi:LemA family protein [Clostridium perfringens]